MTAQELKDKVIQRLNARSGVNESDTAQTHAKPTGEAPSVSKSGKPAFYELDRYVKYRDLLMMIGIASVCYGVSRYSMPAMFILAGIVAVGLSWMMAR